MQIHGITLFELLISLAVAAIVGMLALPSFDSLVASQRSAAVLNQMIGTVQYARNAAATMRQTVTICPGEKDTCGKRNTWQHGVNIFIDRNRNGKMDKQDTVLTRLPGIVDGKLYWRSFRNRSYLQFRSTGLTNWQNGNFLFCTDSQNLKHARMIILNAQGRARKSPDSDNDGIVEDAQGENITCPSIP